MRQSDGRPVGVLIGRSFGAGIVAEFKFPIAVKVNVFPERLRAEEQHWEHKENKNRKNFFHAEVDRLSNSRMQSIGRPPSKSVTE